MHGSVQVCWGAPRNLEVFPVRTLRPELESSILLYGVQAIHRISLPLGAIDWLCQSVLQSFVWCSKQEQEIAKEGPKAKASPLKADQSLWES